MPPAGLGGHRGAAGPALPAVLAAHAAVGLRLPPLLLLRRGLAQLLALGHGGRQDQGRLQVTEWSS